MANLGRPKKVVEEVKEIKQERVKDEVKASEEISKARELEHQQTVIAQLDTDKANKDMLIKSAKELHEHIKDARKQLDAINHEVENGYKAAKHVQDEIKAQNYNLSRQNEAFEKANQDKLRILETKQKEIEIADADYKRLLLEVNESKRKLSNQLQEIAQERVKHQNELNRLNTHVSQVESEDSKLRTDVADREVKLKKAIEAFEAEKEALKPELSRISEIKNENNLLYQKVEEEKAQFERQKSNMDNYKAKLDADDVIRQQQLKNELLKLQNNDARLRKWEQDLNDQALELKARESEASKALKRYQLTQTVKANEE